jgi:hypothetical protein
MQYPNAPKHMFMYRNKTIKNFGYDHETNIDYKFNNLVYRSNIEFIIGKEPIVVLGNTLSFGLCTNIENTFSYKISVETQSPVYNLSWGCYPHTNNELLELLRSILLIDNPRLIIFQINNLNRYRESNGSVNFFNKKNLIIFEYQKFYNEILLLLKDKNHIFLYWDNEDHEVQLPNCLIKNQYFVDTSLKSKEVFGKKSHHLIYLKIMQYIKKNKIL